MTGAAGEVISIDGRSARGLENRRRIVAAMLALVGAGNPSPGAEEVATEAKFGLRTVFRHFDDMDSLFREMNATKRAELHPLVEAALEGKTWRERLESLIERRADVFEQMLPYKSAADARRHGSFFLQEEHGRLVKQQRQSLAAVLPPSMARETTLVEALDLVLSFESWRRLRLDQRLSIPQARRTMSLIARALTADARDPS
jgi:AcrR family transcriptional regulator